MEEKIKKFEIGFTQVANCVLTDKRLSLRAKGMYAYLFSKPEGWVFHFEAMAEELRESKGLIYSAINELITAGYIERIQENAGGRFGGITYKFLPCAEIPYTEKTACGKNRIRKIGTHSNIYNLNNTEYKEKEIYKEKESITKNREIPEKNKEFPDAFARFWGVYPKQRAGSKTSAYRAFEKAVSRGNDAENIIRAAELYAESQEVKKGFAKGCAAWLNDDRFLNQYDDEGEYHVEW